MIKKIILSVFLLASLLLVTSCLPAKERAFAYFIPVGDVNASIKLQLSNPEQASTLRIGDEVDLSLSNISYYDISFASSGIWVLTYDEPSGEWKEAAFDQLTPGQLIERGSDAVAVRIRPQITDNSQPAEIRLVVVGETASSPMPRNKQVAAFIDVTLQP